MEEYLNNEFSASILQLDPQSFEYQEYNEDDISLISSIDIDTSFSGSTDYIEYYVYTEDQDIIFPDTRAAKLLDYDVIDNNISFNPINNLVNLGFQIGKFNIYYNFYRPRLGSSIDFNYYISEISSDRTEIRLATNDLPEDMVIFGAEEFISYS